jgi:hypothetical protein
MRDVFIVFAMFGFISFSGAGHNNKLDYELVQFLGSFPYIASAADEFFGEGLTVDGSIKFSERMRKILPERVGWRIGDFFVVIALFEEGRVAEAESKLNSLFEHADEQKSQLFKAALLSFYKKDHISFFDTLKKIEKGFAAGQFTSECDYLLDWLWSFYFEMVGESGLSGLFVARYEIKVKRFLFGIRRKVLSDGNYDFSTELDDFLFTPPVRSLERPAIRIQSKN